MASEHHTVVVSDEFSGTRLDKWLTTLAFIPSRSRAAELIERGLVTVNGKALKASAKVLPGMKIHVELPAAQPSSLQPLAHPLEILHEDDDLVVINKPAGLVVHPAAGHAQDTLVNILLHHVSELAMGFSENRPGIVHRIDRDTSGILVVAKNDSAHHFLADQFRHKTAHRIYWALVLGRPPVQEKTLTSHLARHPRDRKRFASAPQGKLAITHIRVLQSLPNKITWLECKLETGRTHQIRVHLSEAGWPILGDPIYGGKVKSAGLAARIPRLCLHAVELGFQHPRTQENMFFRVGWPPELARLVNDLGFKNVQA
jgi:23S rRNA pseudouridine1911/1915/1917 synthase